MSLNLLPASLFKIEWGHRYRELTRVVKPRCEFFAKQRIRETFEIDERRTTTNHDLELLFYLSATTCGNSELGKQHVARVCDPSYSTRKFYSSVSVSLSTWLTRGVDEKRIALSIDIWKILYGIIDQLLLRLRMLN